MRYLLLIATVIVVTLTAHASRQSGADAGGVVTIYAWDPLGGAISLATGEGAYVVRDAEVRVKESDLVFHHYQANSFTAGPQGGRIAGILDLGSGHDLQERYGYPETVGNKQGYGSLRIHDGNLVIGRDPKVVDTKGLFEGKVQKHAPVVVGHMYLVRVADENDRSYERLVKLIVLANEPGVSVTLRWQRLR